MCKYIAVYEALSRPVHSKETLCIPWAHLPTIGVMANNKRPALSVHIHMHSRATQTARLNLCNTGDG